MRRKITILTALCLYLLSCADKPPLPQAKMVDLLTDIMLLEAGNQVQYNFAAVPDNIWKRDYAFVCKKNNLDTATFKKSMQWYNERPEIFSKVLEQVLTRLQKRQVEQGRKPGQSMQVPPEMPPPPQKPHRDTSH